MEVTILNAVPVPVPIPTTFDGQIIVDDADRRALASIDSDFRKPDDAAFAQQIYERARTELEDYKKGMRPPMEPPALLPEPKHPPIMVKQGENIEIKLVEINAEFNCDIKVKLAEEFLKIFPKDIEQHRAITELL
ncbi:hypothetical protein CEXT_181551 [Caerostris extrusa]|uniref:Uncharacterized protein n=1 Tax=Caerostris extrusa TaxID=172846 RepID=A0AAV4RI38_CAEEX|nr:hypothetical protein CEXT_181551 [Caerostris extrusa]